MLKSTNRNKSNEWWLREQTTMNLWQYFQGIALEFEKKKKKLASFFLNFNPFHPCHAK